MEDPEQVSEAVIVWSGFRAEAWPHRDERRLVEVFGAALAAQLLAVVKRLEDEFYESDARFTAPDLKTMGDAAAERFRSLHPELSDSAVKALAWCYIFDYK